MTFILECLYIHLWLLTALSFQSLGNAVLIHSFSCGFSIVFDVIHLSVMY